MAIRQGALERWVLLFVAQGDADGSDVQFAELIGTAPGPVSFTEPAPLRVLASPPGDVSAGNVYSMASTCLESRGGERCTVVGTCACGDEQECDDTNTCVAIPCSDTTDCIGDLLQCLGGRCTRVFRPELRAGALAHSLAAAVFASDEGPRLHVYVQGADVPLRGVPFPGPTTFASLPAEVTAGGVALDELHASRQVALAETWAGGSTAVFVPHPVQGPIVLLYGRAGLTLARRPANDVTFVYRRSD